MEKLGRAGTRNVAHQYLATNVAWQFYESFLLLQELPAGFFAV